MSAAPLALLLALLPLAVLERTGAPAPEK